MPSFSTLKLLQVMVCPLSPWQAEPSEPQPKITPSQSKPAGQSPESWQVIPQKLRLFCPSEMKTRQVAVSGSPQAKELLVQSTQSTRPLWVEQVPVLGAQN